MSNVWTGLIYLKQLQQSIQTITHLNLIPSDEGIVPKGVH